MIVLKSTHESVKKTLSDTRAELRKAEGQIEYLASEVYKARNESLRLTLLYSALIEQQSASFTQDDIKRLIQLCHPDKHDGKQSAVEMTAKLLALKERENG